MKPRASFSVPNTITGEGNVAVDITSSGPESDAERERLKAEPARGNLAELGSEKKMGWGRNGLALLPFGRRRGRVFYRNVWRRPTEEAESQGLEISDARKGPGDEILRKESGRVLRDAIRSLPEKYRIAFIMKEIQDMPYDSIAEALGCSGRGNCSRGNWNTICEPLKWTAGPFNGIWKIISTEGSISRAASAWNGMHGSAWDAGRILPTPKNCRASQRE